MLFEGWGRWFLKVSWLCVEGWIQLDVGFVSCVRYLCLRVSPTPDCITKKFREFIGGNSSSYQGLSFQQTHDTIWDLSYVCSGLFCKPILCFVLSCGIRVASMSSVDPYRHASLQVDPIISTSARSNLSFSSTLFVSSISKLPLFFPPTHPFSSRYPMS